MTTKIDTCLACGASDELTTAGLCVDAIACHLREPLEPGGWRATGRDVGERSVQVAAHRALSLGVERATLSLEAAIVEAAKAWYRRPSRDALDALERAVEAAP